MREELEGRERQNDGSLYRGAHGATRESEPTIVIEDEALRRGFTQLPNYLFHVRGLSHSAKLTYALILSYAWQKDYCFPGQETLARDLDVSTRSVIEYLKELQAHGLIRVQRRGLGLTNIYHVLRYPPVPEGPNPTSLPEVNLSSHQEMKEVSAPDVSDSSHPEMRLSSATEVHETSVKTHVASTKKGRKTKNEEQQHAVVSSQTALTLSSGPREIALAALAAHGIRNKGLLEELVSEPSEALAQIERLQEEIVRGVVVNPAGWLIEAIRGRYRLGDDEREGRAVSSLSMASDLNSALDEQGMDDGSAAGVAWRAVLSELRAELTQENYVRWFQPTRAVAYDEERLMVAAPDLFHAQWLDRRLRSTVERAARRVLGEVEILFMMAERESA